MNVSAKYAHDIEVIWIAREINVSEDSIMNK